MAPAKKNTDKKKLPKRRRRFGLSFFNFFFLVAVACFLFVSLATLYVVNSDEDMEWLRARIENSINERADGAFAIRIASARIAVRDELGAKLHLGEIYLEGKDQRFSLAGRQLSIRPNWFSVLSDNIQIKSATFDDAYLNVRMPAAADEVRADVIAGEKLLSELENSAAGGFNISDQFQFDDLSRFSTIDGEGSENDAGENAGENDAVVACNA